MDTDAQKRKQHPVYSGVLEYFPDAIYEVAHCSWVGNEQHHPNEPLWWDKSKSTDEADALVRHLMEAGTRDTDGVRHASKVAWRALAMLQREIEAEHAEMFKDEYTPTFATTDWENQSGAITDFHTDAPHDPEWCGCPDCVSTRVAQPKARIQDLVNKYGW